MKIVHRLSLITLVSLIAACATAPRKKPPQVASVDAKRELQRIQVDVAAGAEKRAVARLKNLVTRFPKSDVADEATIQLARLYAKQNNYAQAYPAFMSLIETDVFSPNEAEAVTGASKCLFKMGRLDEALALSQRGLDIPGLSDAAKLELYRSRFTVAVALGDRFDALKALAFIAEKDPRPEVRANALGRATEMVNTQLGESDLEKIVSQSNLGFVRASAAYRLGTFRMREKNFGGARDQFSRARDWGRGTAVEPQAEAYLAQLDSRSHVDPYVIGAVLPLTGRYAPIARKTLQGLQLGLGVYGAERSAYKLAVVDSEGTPEGARKGVERLVTEDNVIAVVGSLLSKTAFAVASKTEELGVPSFALSQKAGLTDAGVYTFRNAVTSETQVRELARVAINQLGLRRFAVLYPNEPYGVEFANIFWDEVLAHGGQINGAQPYSTSETDFRGPIKRLVGTYYLDDRKIEYQNRVRAYFKEQKSARARQSVPDDLLPPTVDFDAIFIPDGPKAIGQIAPMLAYQGVTNVRLLGTNVWNTPDLVRRGQKNIERAIFVDTNIDRDPAFKSSKFFREYQRTFGEEPSFFEMQGYEVGILLRQMIDKGERTRPSLVQALTNLKSFEGVTGPMAMSAQHELQRPLTAFTVKDAEIVPFVAETEVEPTRPARGAVPPRKAGRR